MSPTSTRSRRPPPPRSKSRPQPARSGEPTSQSLSTGSPAAPRPRWGTRGVENSVRRDAGMNQARGYVSLLTGSFSTPAAGNPTVVIVEAAYRHRGLDARYINCEVSPESLGDAVRGARAMGWAGFNCSLPHKVAVITHLDRLAVSAEMIGAVNCVVSRDGELVVENTDGRGFVVSLQTVVD